MRDRRVRRAGSVVAVLAIAVLALTTGPRIRSLIGVAGVQQERTLQRAIDACPSFVEVSAPASNLSSTVASSAAGTCFRLAAGTYRFHDVVPKDDMVFVGASASTVIVDGNGRENAFHGTASNVTIGRMTFSTFNSSAGTSRQEQSPIRGTARLWASDRGQMATGWLVEDIVSHSNYASGIFMGEHWIVRNSEFHSNGVTGIGGDHFVGGLIEGNVVHHNGAQQAAGALVNGGGIKVTQAGTPAHPVIVRDNEIYANQKIGIWCDIGCDGFHVLDNYIHDHVSRGVMYELSSNLLVRGNTILRSNTWTNFNGEFNAGAITVGESSGALVENNLIETAEAGVTVRQTHRPASGENFLYNYPYVNWTVRDVVVRNNVIRDTGQMGISTGQTGRGEIADPNSVVFTGNSYDDPSSMTFWWNNGERLNFAQWQAAGRDTSSSGSTPPSTAGADRGPSGGTTPTPTPTQPPTAGNPQPTPATDTTQPVGAPGDPAPVEVPFRLNTGGGAYTDFRGFAWQADDYFEGGQVAEHAEGVDIGRTSTDEIYRDERWGEARYEIPVEDGRYRVVLHHAEVFDGCQSVGCRRFSVEVEGHQVENDLDVFSSVGGFSALAVETTQVVTDGFLTIELGAISQNPQISAIEVLSATTSNQPAADDSDDSAASPDPTSSTTEKDAAESARPQSPISPTADESSDDDENPSPTQAPDVADAAPEGDGSAEGAVSSTAPSPSAEGPSTIDEATAEPDDSAQEVDGGGDPDGLGVDAPDGLALVELADEGTSGLELLFGTLLAVGAGLLVTIKVTLQVRRR
ncbi:MAG: malectin domain-containing carbohydrate-binding protein [Acidimicrobiales bacterium]